MLEYTLRTSQSPTRLVQRLGAIQELGSEASRLGMRRPVDVAEAGVKAAGLLEVALEARRRSDVEPVVFDKVRANPGVSLVDEGATDYGPRGGDGLVATGGGSPRTPAKGIGVVAAHNGSIVDYEWGHSPIESRIPPMIAVPTTAGTGSEVTLWAVITDPNRKIKFNVGGTPHIASWVAVIDPELTVKLPPAVTAGTGMDALAHAVECYTMSYHQPFTDAVALPAMEYVARYLRGAFSQANNLEARYHMSAAAMLAGRAYGTDSAGAAPASNQTAAGVSAAPPAALTAKLLCPAMSVKKMFIEGRWVESEGGELFDADSPATGEIIAEVPKGTRADAQRAVEAAHKARAAMAGLKGFERSVRLHRIADAIARRRDELAHLLTLDQGKPLKAEAVGEVEEAVQYFRIAAEDLKRLEGRVLPSASPSKLVLARHYPRGVYGIITPWNWPLTMAAELIAPALAAGNSVVWTPATSTSVISVALMECMAECHFPAGALNLVTGPGAEAGDEVAGHPLVDGVGFVGSTETDA